ncbi:CoA transferase [Azospirillum sp. ST 5-10]|uniref:CoA transferase n=1 Tax=unclassified Azospirillum TaxID=2630922 RepID=UPI003F4A2BD6
MLLHRKLDEILGDEGAVQRSAPSVEITGHDPIYPTPFRVGEAGAVALAGYAMGINEIWRQRSGRGQTAVIDVAAAAVSLKSVAHLLQQGYPVPFPDPAYPLTDFHRCRDGRSIFLHAGYPKLRDGLLKLLGCPNDRAAIDAAVATWDSGELEDAAAAAGLCAGIARSAAEWEAHPQGRLLAAEPVVRIDRIGDGAPQPFAAAARPLAGVRVLDLTHVLAGPTATRTLAEQGATVLRVRAPQNPTIPSFVMDTGHGKLSTVLDLTQAGAARRIEELIGEADVLVQSYRPGALDALGFSPAAVAARRPGIVYVSVSCYGDEGPWGQRRGWEQLAQSVTGMAVVQGSPDAPALSPVYPNDYVTGYLAAYGVTAALLRRAETGGSHHVRVSLCRTAMWLQSFGTVPADRIPAEPQVPPGLLPRLMLARQTPYGRLDFLGPVSSYSETVPSWERPTVPLAADPPVWPRFPALEPDEAATAEAVAV